MRTGIWFPVSSELIGFAFLLAIIVVVVYVILKSAQKSVEQSEKRNIESNFFDESTNLLAFGFPTKSETVFKDKFISADKGIAFLICPSSEREFLSSAFNEHIMEFMLTNPRSRNSSVLFSCLHAATQVDPLGTLAQPGPYRNGSEKAGQKGVA